MTEIAAARETLYLIDGYAQIFRAFHAIRGGMRSPVTGEPTQAIFGFSALLIKLLRDLKPGYVVVALDAPGPTFRDDLYADYKATRSETPDDLKAQFPRVRELIDRFGIAMIEQPGLEADDIIGTIVQRLLDDPATANLDIRIASKDKDLEQLLCNRVVMFDIQTDTLTDAAALAANKGVTPAQVVDLLTLTGDTSDNVRGVDGVGPKTAAQLIQQFGSLDGILANLDKLSVKRREAFEKAASHLPLSRTLVTLKRDGEFPFDLQLARTRPPDPSRLIPF
ncbi:MAG: 5'-3' exonuclease, partial [Chloroflexota bacterium]